MSDAVPAERITTREANEGDVPRLIELIAGGTLRQENPSDLAPYLDAFAEMHATPGTTVMVAELDGQVVGMCQLFTFRHLQEHGGRCAELESMHVDAAYRSRGIGGVLLRAAVEWAEARGCYRIQLTSNKVRDAAHRFYLRHGFDASHVGFKRYL